MPSYLRSIAAWALATVALATVGGAATHLAEGYAIRVWQTENGLPQNLVTSAVQTRDGYLWFGTASGLARFDGERFEVFNSTNTPELRDRRIGRVFEDQAGTLWIGHESGAITRYAAGRFTAVAPPTGIENERVIGLGSDDQGRLWALRENGAVDSLTDGRRLPSLIAAERPGIMAWTRNARGDIWLAENGRAARLADGELTLVMRDVSGIAAARDGGAWIVRDNLIRKWRDGRWTEDLGSCPWPPSTISTMLELRDGTLAVGTVQSGLYLVFRDGRRPVRFDRTNGLPQDWIRFLYEDREGSLWAGTGSAGVVSIYPTPLSVLNAPDQWEGCSVLSVAPGRDGGLWIGTDGAGLYHHAAGNWKQYAAPEGLGNQYIWSVTETPAGEVWAGHYWWGGPFRLEQGRFVRPTNVDETWSAAVALVPVPATGELLVGNRDGLLRLKEGEPSVWLIKSPEGSSDDACAVVRDRDGDIWCGFAQGGLAHWSGGKVTVYRKTDGLASDAVHCLLADDDGTLWIGTADNGLSRFREGKFATVGREQGLADDVVCYLLDDGLGYLWLSTHHGIQRIAKEELNRCADGVIPRVAGQLFDRTDGLPIVEFTGGRQAAGCRTRDGRLWFASSKGLVSVDPARIRPNELPPPVVLESLVVDGATVPINGPGALRVAPDHERLEFQFSGLSFVAPEKVRFKYRLDGIDKGWVDRGSERSASYSRLPAGTYRFSVIACNNDGVWNTQGASLAFTVLPFFWQTWWFIAISVLAATAAVASLARAVTRRRMQRQMAAMERQHAIELERARIAQDIHDDVGASLSRIAMLSQPARSQLAEPDRAAAVLTRIYTTAREVTRALDEIVWAVDPRHDTLDSLIDYMGRFAQDLLAVASLRCRLDLPVQVPPWPLTAETRHNLFLAFKEALNNAVKHASATEVRIALHLRADAIELVVRDNGRGFVAAGTQRADAGRISGGNGLQNMSARLTRIGGRCEVCSAPGSGTSVSFLVTVREASATSRPQSDPTEPAAHAS